MDGAPSVCVAQYPRLKEVAGTFSYPPRDLDAEERFAAVQQVIRGVRKAKAQFVGDNVTPRGTYGVRPTEAGRLGDSSAGPCWRPVVTLRAADQTGHGMLETFGDLIATLSRTEVSLVAPGTDFAGASDCALSVVGEVEVFLHVRDLVDAEAELKKIAKRQRELLVGGVPCPAACRCDPLWG